MQTVFCKLSCSCSLLNVLKIWLRVTQINMLNWFWWQTSCFSQKLKKIIEYTTTQVKYNINEITRKTIHHTQFREIVECVQTKRYWVKYSQKNICLIKVLVHHKPTEQFQDYLKTLTLLRGKHCSKLFHRCSVWLRSADFFDEYEN